MVGKSLRRNPFEALCVLASKEGWCWKISCVTCAHMYFRCGFMELARGRHPDAPDWLVSKSHRNQFCQKLGPVWTDTLGPSEDDQNTLLAVLSEASLPKIARQCRFPAWLGYLGLGLSYTEGAEKQNLVLTKSWKPQLLEMLPNNADAMRLMKLCLFDGDDAPLRWEDLSRIKEALIIGARIQDEPSMSFSVR
jgi:hypothetical protein